MTIGCPSTNTPMTGKKKGKNVKNMCSFTVIGYVRTWHI